ncbi:uncharacterized protein [Mytilus edulis]|uniref:uncharacterized protein isoform X2 n=1 Tax=Mytilus edulis TaxID=6550 RepID=UPI0039EEF6BE
MMRALTIVFMVQLPLISVSLGEHKKWSEDKSSKYTKEKYTDMDDTYYAAWLDYLDFQQLEATKHYSKDIQDNGDTDEESDKRTTCGIGSICDRCDHFKLLLIRENYVKVCCRSCSKDIVFGNYEDGDKKLTTCTCKYDRYYQEAAEKYSKDKQDNGDTNEESDERTAWLAFEAGKKYSKDKQDNGDTDEESYKRSYQEAAKKYSKDKQDNGDTDEESDKRTNCGIGSICDRCDHFKHILIGEDYVKVCCKSCSEHFVAGYYEDGDKTQPHCACKYDYIKGDCWKGLACSACDKSVVGNINGVPVCCENCEKSGIRYGFEGQYNTCDCLHNGKE